MNRHERCEAAIAAQPVDRLPAYLPGIACDVASELLGRKVHTGSGSLHYAESCAWMKGDDAHAAFEHQLLEGRRIRDESGGTACFQGPSNAIIKGTPVKNVEALFAAR